MDYLQQVSAYIDSTFQILMGNFYGVRFGLCLLLAICNRILTAPNRHFPWTISTNCCAISSATRVCASTVLAPRCGVEVTLGCWINSRFVGGSCNMYNNVAGSYTNWLANGSPLIILQHVAVTIF